MKQPLISNENIAPATVHRADVLLAQKRKIRALKRVLIAKAEVRRLRSLVGRQRIKAG